MTISLPSRRFASSVAGLCAFALTAFTLPPAHAAAATPVITAQNAWVRWLPGTLPAAGYVTLANRSDKPVDLVDVSSSDYGSAMLHQAVSAGSTQKMVMVDKLTVPAHGSVSIAPGGYHLMLEDAKHPIAPGNTVHLQLHFSDSETLDTPFAVKPPTQQN
jgi:copper(I)-binding protein